MYARGHVGVDENSRVPGLATSFDLRESPRDAEHHICTSVNSFSEPTGTNKPLWIHHFSVLCLNY